jgi:membrane protease YdiL (CAAX protease family)
MRLEAASRKQQCFEAWAVCGYTLTYFGWLFIHQEGELWHWLTLVLLPLLLLGALHWRGGVHFSSVWQSVGLAPAQPARGIATALLLGLGFCALQLLLSNQRAEILGLFNSGRALLLLPLALLLLLATAGFTEELFFRGILQTRLARLTRSPLAAAILAALIFGLYHVPYAMLNPHWPSYGNWRHAVALSLGQGLPVGLVLGLLFNASQRNLLACVLLHAMIDVLPAMLLVAKMLS